MARPFMQGVRVTMDGQEAQVDEVLVTQACARTSGVEDFDVLVIGAGISGIGSACHLRSQSPGKSFAILEAKDDIGGTWHTYKYPGVRSDSNLYTFGYRFKPWVGPPIATGAEILKYLESAIAQYDLGSAIRFNTTITRCTWSSRQARWTVETRGTDGSATRTYRCRFLWMCQGYYDHQQPYLPQWRGVGDFRGRLIHAQQWVDGVDYTDKQVVVIGSGATAATVIPAMADKAAHVTMLQRSPTYFMCYPNRSDLADRLRNRCRRRYRAPLRAT